MPKQPRAAACDFEEVRPGLFIVHTSALRPVLRGEGDVDGDRFLLTSHRREGLFARLRARSFSVRSLDDLLAALPTLPAVLPPGPPTPHAVAAGERYSQFAGPYPGWQPLEPEPSSGPPHILLCAGWAVRRKRGRGAADYFLASSAPGGRLELTTVGENRALLHGYAQLALDGGQTIVGRMIDTDLVLPDLPLPTMHAALLRRLGEKTKEGWLLQPAGMPWGAALLDTLGVTLGPQQ